MNSPTLAIELPMREITAFCVRHHIVWFALFGSVLSDAFRPDSDVDVLVRFDPDHIPGWEFVDMQDELTLMLGRAVDLNTPGFLSDTFRDEAIEAAYVIYERAG